MLRRLLLRELQLRLFDRLLRDLRPFLRRVRFHRPFSSEGRAATRQVFFASLHGIFLLFDIATRYWGRALVSLAFLLLTASTAEYSRRLLDRLALLPRDDDDDVEAAAARTLPVAAAREVEMAAPVVVDARPVPDPSAAAKADAAPPDPEAPPPPPPAVAAVVADGDVDVDDRAGEAANYPR